MAVPSQKDTIDLPLKRFHFILENFPECFLFDSVSWWLHRLHREKPFFIRPLSYVPSRQARSRHSRARGSWTSPRRTSMPCWVPATPSPRPPPHWAGAAATPPPAGVEQVGETILIMIIIMLCLLLFAKSVSRGLYSKWLKVDSVTCPWWAVMGLAALMSS